MIKCFSILALLLSISLVSISSAFADSNIEELERRAASGDTKAQYALAEEYDPSIKPSNSKLHTKTVKKDMKKAMFWYKKAAENGVSEAQFILGLIYADGEYVKKNMKKAVEYLSKAAEQGHGFASYNLGVYYANGDGVRQNYKKSLEYFTIAADKGDAKAQFNIGIQYLNGSGVRQNKSTAKEWFGKACDNGIEPGCKQYKMLNEQGIQ